MKLLSIGECMIELSGGGAPDLWRMGFAGDTLNTAWYLRKLVPRDWRVGYCTRIGEDAQSAAMLEFFAGAGLDTRHVQRDPRRSPGLYMISLTDGERSFTYWRDSSAARQLAADPDLLRAALADQDMVYLSGITVAILPEADRLTLLNALGAFRAAGRRVVFDPNLRPRLWQDAAEMRDWTAQAAGVADIVLPSFDDEAAAFGDADTGATLARYAGYGATEVVVKNAGGPMLALAGGQVSSAAAPERITPRDTTGAGDSFNAGYLAARLQGAAPEAALAQGHEVARQVIQQPGAICALAL